MNANFREKFLTNTEDTGRFIVTSIRTGKKYFVECLDNNIRNTWGDLDPATKKMSSQYGKKYRGCIDKEESLITKENGFETIHELDVGVSPHHAIEVIDAKYPDKE